MINSPVSHLESCLNARAIRGEIPQESKAHKITRICLQILSAPIGVMGNLPYIAISRAFAGPHKVYGYLLAVGNMGAFFPLFVYAILDIVKKELSPHTQEELLLSGPKRNSLCSVLKKTAMIGMGLLSQVPAAYMAYVYNNKSLFQFFDLLFFNAILPIFSLFLTAEKLALLKKQTPLDKKTDQLRTILLALMARNLSENVHSQEGLRALKNAPEITAFLTRLIQQTDLIKTPKAVEITGKVIGAFLALCSLSVIYVLGYHASLLLFSLPAIAHLSSAFIAFCNLCLKLEMGSTFAALFSGIYRCLTCSFKSDSLRHAPALSSLLYLLATFCLSFAYGPSIKVATDYFTKGWRTFFQISFSMSSTVLALMGNLGVIEPLIFFLSKFSKDPTKKSFAELQERVEFSKDLIERSSPREFREFFLSLPDSITAPIFQTANLTREDLESDESVELLGVAVQG